MIALPLAIYLYVAGDHKPKLTYFVHPAKAAVVRSGQSAGLTVTFAGKPLTGDVTAAQIAFWNDGERAIHRDDVLKPLRIFIRPARPILEAKLRKTSRDVVLLQLDQSHLDHGEVTVRWNILEPKDGGVIQLIFEGDEKTEIRADAVVEGQQQIVGVTYDPRVETATEAYNKRRTRGWLLATQTASGIAGVAIGIASAMVLFRRTRLWNPVVAVLALLLASLGLLILAVLVLLGFLRSVPPAPPFDF